MSDRPKLLPPPPDSGWSDWDFRLAHRFSNQDEGDDSIEFTKPVFTAQLVVQHLGQTLVQAIKINLEDAMEMSQEALDDLVKNQRAVAEQSMKMLIAHREHA